ncbi:WD-40 repeat protein, putative [Eimeria mitis]|uniref:WD-40 repeat protein, putative n=1 Tax=Eimeria mitis TaxID=44415 RepID=U6KAQ4_9EIME|nr:WD-40 repeat protein, putative [Eimeria mitis]CDJ33856.1 WD-40 repeat protein, putative [Eimeria mitis]
MALRARQEQQLHLAIALYLESKFPEAHKAFEREAHIDFSAATSTTRGEEKFDSETLPKRWGATARLQARVTVLQQQLQQQQQQLNLFTSAATGPGKKARLQARVTVLQQQLQQQQQQLNLFTSAATGPGKKEAAGLPNPKPSCIISAQRQPLICCVFHPLLPQLLAGADDGNVRVISVEGSSNAALSRTFRAHDASVTGLAFDVSGRWWVFT